MTAHWTVKQNANEGCNSCASLAGLVLSFIACFVLLLIAPLIVDLLTDKADEADESDDIEVEDDAEQLDAVQGLRRSVVAFMARTQFSQESIGIVEAEQISHTAARIRHYYVDSVYRRDDVTSTCQWAWSVSVWDDPDRLACGTW